ncbi:MAG: AMP-binding protein [Planctomycetes bacterium]|nr:AMP-binding protein [Planctomycetota bacterium]
MLDLSRLTCLGEALRDSTIAFQSSVALLEADRKRENGRWTYREVRGEAERVAARLQQGGFGPGDRCAILLSNQARWLLSGIGALWAGATIVPLDYKLTAAEQAALLVHARPRVLVTEYTTWRTLLRERLSGLDALRVLVTEAPEKADLGRAERWEEAAATPFRYVQRCRADVACIVYSSGTGGTPKGCMLTHDNYLEQAQVLGRLFPMEEGERYFSILPTNHAIDFMCGFLLPLLFGGSVVHQRTLRPEFIEWTMQRYRVTHMAVVPLLLKALERRIRERLEDLPDLQRSLVEGLIAANEALTMKAPNHALSARLLKPVHDKFGGRLRLLFAGGAFVDRTTAEFFYRLGLPVVIGYGLTEAGTVVTVNDLKPFRPDTVGRPVPGTEIELRDANASGVGEVWVRGRTVMRGYLDAPELTAEALVDGWLRTGDLGTIDASGHLKLVGRTKNMIVTEGGKNIYPEDLEAAFEEVDGCRESCVFAANFIWPTGKMTDEELVLVVRPEEDGDADGFVGELRARNRRLADFKRLSGYVVWRREFPRTASMKVKRQELARQLAAETERARALRPLGEA